MLDQAALAAEFDVESTETIDLELDFICQASVAHVQAVADELVEKSVGSS